MNSVEQRNEYCKRLLSAIPLEMQNMQRFCFALFTAETKGKDPRKWHKQPAGVKRNESGKAIALVTDDWNGSPERFCTLKEAITLYSLAPAQKKISAIGFYFWEGDGLVGIDIDTLETPLPIKDAPKTTYVELSRSNSGVHFIGKGAPITKADKANNLEIYSKGRYFLLTGTPFAEYKANGKLADLNDFVAKLSPHQTNPLTDWNPFAEGFNISASIAHQKSSTETSPGELLPVLSQMLAYLDPNMGNDAWVNIGLAIGNFYRHTNDARIARDVFTRWSYSSVLHKGEEVETGARIHDFFNPDRKAVDNPVLIGTVIKAAAEKGFNISLITNAVARKYLIEDPEAAQRFPLVGESVTITGLDQFSDVKVEKFSHSPDKAISQKAGTEEDIKKINYKEHPVEVALQFAKKDGEHTLVLIDKLWWRYDKELHYWIEVGNVAIVEHAIEEFIIQHKYNYIPCGDKPKAGEKRKVFPCNNIRSVELTEVRKAAERFCVQRVKVIPNTWFSPSLNLTKPNVVALKNCLLDLNTHEVLPHTPKFFNTAVLPFDYDAEAVCPTWLSAMKDWFPGEPWVETELQKAFATTLITNQNFKQLFCCYGVTNSGKTTATNMLKEMLGDGYKLAATAKSLSSDFGFSGVDKAKLLLLEEFSIEKLRDDHVEILKQLTGGGDVRVNEKNTPPRYGVCKARIFITTNTEPWKHKDPAQALVKRTIIFHFASIEGKLDKGFENKLRVEMPGIFNWVLDGAKALMRGQVIVQPSGRGADLLMRFKAAGLSTLDRFVLQNLCFDRNAPAISTKDIFSRYKALCKLNNVEPNPDDLAAFGKQLKIKVCDGRHLSEVTEHRTAGTGIRGYVHLRVKAEEEDMLEDEKVEDDEWTKL